MSRFSFVLRDTLRDQYGRRAEPEKRKSWFRREPDWVLSARFQELRRGKLGVHVRAQAAEDQEMAKEWNKYFSDSETFLEEVEAFANQIASDLSNITTRS